MPRRVVLETLLFRPFRVVENFAERAPVAWSGGANGQVAVGRADRLIGRGGLVGGAQRAWHLPGREVAARLPHLQRHSRLEERHIDELAAAGPSTCRERRESRPTP